MPGRVLPGVLGLVVVLRLVDEVQVAYICCGSSY